MAPQTRVRAVRRYRPALSWISGALPACPPTTGSAASTMSDRSASSSAKTFWPPSDPENWLTEGGIKNIGTAVNPKEHHKATCRQQNGGGSQAPTAVAVTAEELSGTNDLAGLQAGRASVDLAHGARLDQGANGLDVRVPAALGTAVGVGHVHPEARALATNITDGSHLAHPNRNIRPGREPNRSSRLNMEDKPDARPQPGNRPRLTCIGGRTKSARGRFGDHGSCQSVHDNNHDKNIVLR